MPALCLQQGAVSREASRAARPRNDLEGEATSPWDRHSPVRAFPSRLKEVRLRGSFPGGSWPANWLLLQRAGGRRGAWLNKGRQAGRQVGRWASVRAGERAGGLAGR